MGNFQPADCDDYPGEGEPKAEDCTRFRIFGQRAGLIATQQVSDSTTHSIRDGDVLAPEHLLGTNER